MSDEQTDKPGDYQGRHYTTYVNEVRVLRQAGKDEAVERLLLALVEATEAESRAEGGGVAPWYYEQLAVLYHKRKDYVSELGVLERFDRQRHAPGVAPAHLKERLAKTRELGQQQ